MTILTEIEREPGYQPEWTNPDMSMLEGNRIPAPKLPLQVFGPVASWLSQAAEVKNSPVDYVAAGLLAASAALIGNTRKVSPWTGWDEPSVLWLIPTGNPSSGKSPALDAVLDAVRVIQREQQEDYPDKKQDYETALEVAKNERLAWEKDVKEAVEKKQTLPPKPVAACDPEPPTRIRLMINDATIEALGKVLKENPRGILMNRDELAGWMENMGRYSTQGADRAFWIEAFGGRHYQFDRVKNQADPVVIDRLSVSILGGIQPDRLASVLMSGDDDGMAARFLYVWPDSVPPKRPQGAYSHGVIIHTLKRLYSLPMQEEPQVMTLVPEAANLFQSFRDELYEMEEGATGLLLGHIGKLPGITLRLAMVLELLWWAAGTETNPPGQVSEKAIKGACALVFDYFLPMAHRAFGDAALPQVEKTATVLARWIHKNKPSMINSRDITRQRIAGIAKADLCHSVLYELEEAGWISAQPSRAGETPGRKRQDYAVNPRVWGMSA